MKIVKKDRSQILDLSNFYGTQESYVYFILDIFLSVLDGIMNFNFSEKLIPPAFLAGKYHLIFIIID